MIVNTGGFGAFVVLIGSVGGREAEGDLARLTGGGGGFILREPRSGRPDLKGGDCLGGGAVAKPTLPCSFSSSRISSRESEDPALSRPRPNGFPEEGLSGELNRFPVDFGVENNDSDDRRVDDSDSEV